MAAYSAAPSVPTSLATQLDPDVAPIELTQQVNSVDGVPQVYMCLAVKLDDAGKPQQLRCAEMMHWDDLRQANNTNDGTPQMMQHFATPGQGRAPPMPLTEGTSRMVYASAAIDICLAGASSQPFCTEMLHWDDLCEAKSNAGPSQVANNPQPVLMRDLFKPIRSEQRWFLQDGKLFCEVSVSRFSSANAPISSEMLHWSDLQPTSASPAPPKIGLR